MTVFLFAGSSFASENAVLPSGVIGKFDTHSSAHYLIYDETRSGWAPDAAQVLECALDQFYEVWRDQSMALAAPRQPLVWLHFTERQSFDDYAQTVDRADLSWAEGYYSAKTHRVAVFSRRGAAHPDPSSPGDLEGIHATSGTHAVAVSPSDDLPRLTHEAAHQLAFESGLFQRGVTYPLWLSEGLALHFEADDEGRVGAGASHAARRARLAEAARQGRLVPLSRFLTLTTLPTEDPAAVDAIYDQAWGVFALLLEERPAALREYLQLLAQQQAGRRSESARRAEVDKTFGDVAALDAAWVRFVLEPERVGGGQSGTHVCP